MTVAATVRFMRGLPWLCLGLGLGVAACATAGGGGSSSLGNPVETVMRDPPMRVGAPVILIAMPNSPDFGDVRRGLVVEVQKNFNVSTLLVTSETSEADLAAAITRAAPVCVVLMNNSALNLFQRYETAHKERPALPAVVVMASFLEEVRSRLRRAIGIAYEVPGVTAFVNLRAIVETPVRRVGVVYRSAFKHFIERQQKLAAKEHVKIVGREVARDVSAEGLRAALHLLVSKDKVDALWMLNDNDLIRDAHFLDEAWRAELRVSKLPLIVNARNLVDPASPLGTLAVVPDHEALGLQAANLIFDLADAGWQVEGHAIDLPLSVRTIVDLKQARDGFGLRPDALHRIDKALE